MPINGESFNPYKILGIRRNAKAERIKRAYRSTSKRTHPDVGGSVDGFIRVRRAYFILTDPERRRRYDETGEINEQTELQLQSNVAGCLAQLFDAFLRDGKVFRRDVDVIASMREIAEKKRDELKASLVEGHALLKSIDGLAKRIDRKEGENLFVGMLAQHGCRSREKIQKVEAEKAIFEGALKELETYSCVHEMAQFVGMQRFTNSTTTTTGFG